MKKIIYLLLSMTMLAACTAEWLDESEHPMPEGVGEKPEFIFDGESTVYVSKLGGDYTAAVKANQPWLVESSDSWITVTSSRTGKGDGSYETVSFTVQKNLGLEPRSGKIRMWITDEDEAYINIEQEPLLIEDMGNDYYVKADGTGDGSSWENAMSLSAALEAAVDADKIHVAAGKYIPETILPGGKAGDETFFVKANIHLIGGYPADAREGDQPDPAANPTILSGEDTYYHVMVVGNPDSELFDTEISGFTMTKGKAMSGAESIMINGAKAYRSYGAGLLVAGSKVTFTDCIITENTTGNHNAGAYIADGAEVCFRRCSFTSNTGKNGACIWNSASTTYMYDCLVSQNSASGVGAGIYNFDAQGSKRAGYMYIANTEISGNTATASRGGGYYGREASEAVMINCTVHSNTCQGAAGIGVYGTSGSESSLTLISTTVTGNNATSKAGGGVECTSNATLHVYNSIISGNTSAVKGTEDLLGQDSEAGSLPAVIRNTVVGKAVYGDGVQISGSFDFMTMFGPCADGVYPLTGTDNPAMTSGMSADELKEVSSGISLECRQEDLLVDQKGNARTGSVMGSYVGR